ncbi:MAG: NAD(P)-dependent oxidoreductase [Verrucomicrobia bacterium]|jgi:3-hydroxyisobutyrate dehydrogenase-like beta-hydroxyacid dehydrogenase|nr:NAD(P)-dependent oxidoreductase [Verrucomicrobiota bacterium]
MNNSVTDLDQQLPVIGVVGVGLLGSAIAARLVEKAYSVVGYDPVHFDVTGVGVSESIPKLISKVSVLILCLPDSAVAKFVIDEGRLALHEGHTVIDTTTGRPDDMVFIGEKLRKQNVNYVEANVAGSSIQVLEGTSTLFVGGHSNAVEANARLFNAIAKQWFHLGIVGEASNFKLVHNMILGLHRLVLAEGMEFARALGMNASKVLDILKKTPAYSTVMDTKGTKMVHGNFDKPQARLSQHLKDVQLMQELAERSGAKTPLTSLHQQILESAVQMGFGPCDNSAVLEFFKSNQPDSDIS